MCCSAWPVTFSSTITGTYEVLIENVVNHVIWYQNQVDGTAVAEPHAPSVAGGNCLIIPLLGSWESIRLLNTFDTPNILKNIRYALEPERSRGRAPTSAATGSLVNSIGRIAFMQFDVYDILIAEHASDIPGLLPQINAEKRPIVNDAVFHTLENWYRAPLALCCFRSTDQAEAKPIAFAFEPRDPSKLVVYTLDAHDGNAPVPDAIVELDHTIFVGSYLMPKEFCAQVRYTDQVPDHLRPYLLNQLLGRDIRSLMINGDIVFDTNAVREGFFEGHRRLPQYAPHGYRQLVQPLLTREDYYASGQRSRQRPASRPE